MPNPENILKKHHTGGKKGAPKPPKLLVDMRHVYMHPEPAQGEPERLKTLRDFMEDDPKGFVSQMSRLEAEVKKSKTTSPGSEGKGGPGTADEGEMRISELIERILGEAGL